MPKPYALVMLLATLGLPLTGLAATPTVRIDSGELIGTESDGVASFRGIPYAAPPVGALRWRAPQRPGAWKQPRSAADFGPSCLQAQPPRRLPAGSAAARLDEDCLTLNVWTPAAHAKPLPVMVFIHGGSNLQGSGASIYYDGSTFAHDGVILVTLNYRLGLLGFFAHASLTHASSSEPLANYGIMDQIAALEWVSRNIAAFGGDPHNVTVFGESAGALDALILMTAPRAAHLFHKAIVESAPIWGNWFSLAEAEKQGAEVATAMGLSGANASVNELRAVAASHVLAVDPSYVLGPVVDGKLTHRDFRARAGPGYSAHHRHKRQRELAPRRGAHRQQSRDRSRPGCHAAPARAVRRSGRQRGSGPAPGVSRCALCGAGPLARLALRQRQAGVSVPL